ncbi:KEX1 [[Candida] subhashii]|uniref:KEX1 n=1 Tax=[Candida] subhashii TaxID=561895 RepID=A0A8J5QFH1_9ASCO|nr:KEX1 [[Candida] subhashii]KAG7660645.1 KEX1 [[Candida] subhashii]
MLIYNLITVLICTITTTLALPPKFVFDGPESQRKYLVTNLPGLSDNLQPDQIPLMFAGQLQLHPENHSSYFFWKFSDPYRIPENKKRTIFWLNGGPGCSSMDGALMEVGPLRVEKGGKLGYNNGSWHRAADIVFIDQPVGTGFSFADKLISELNQVSDYMLVFLKKYFEIFPEELDNDIYFAGESYAGQYIPYIANGILDHNEKSGEKPYNLKGVMIGNGWISPNEQSLSYFPFFYNHGLIKTNNPHWGSILNQVEECQRLVDEADAHWNDNTVDPAEVNFGPCDAILNKLLQSTGDGQCINMYDYLLRDSFPSCGMNWPPDLKDVTPYLRDRDVVNALNLEHIETWKECSGSVSNAFTAKNSFPAVHLLPRLTENIQVVLFNGDRDIICNTMGTLSFLKKLEWGGSKGFTDEETNINWIYDNEDVGYIKTERNMTFINVYNASHMVPFDVPNTSRALIDLITRNYDEVISPETNQTSFVTYPLGVRKQLQDTPPTDSTNNSTTTTTTTTAESKEPTSNKITRVIQLLVICILMWGIYVLYSSYKSRPSSIIRKTGKSVPSNKKKNVQWADQLHSYEDDDIKDFESDQQEGFFKKALHKLTGTSVTGGDNRGNYVPTSSQYIEDIELGEGIRDESVPDDFIIASDDEEVVEEGQERDLVDDNKKSMKNNNKDAQSS